MSFGVLLVAIRDKDMFVYDGQTRLAAAMKREDITEVPCALFEVESTEEEAKGFLGSNVNRKAVKALDKFKAQLMVNHPAACAVKKLCDDHGIRILDGGGAGTTKCVRIMMDLWVPFPQIMEKLFPLFALLARDHALLERVIAPLMYIESRLVKQDVTLTKNPWMNRVLRLGATGIVKAAGEAAAYHAHGGAAVWAEGVLKALNHGMRQRIAIKPPENGDDQAFKLARGFGVNRPEPTPIPLAAKEGD
jgi:hypothetical protein